MFFDRIYRIDMIISFIQKLKNDNSFAFYSAREKKNLKENSISIEVVSKCSILSKVKEDENYNRRNTQRIARIIIFD